MHLFIVRSNLLTALTSSFKPRESFDSSRNHHRCHITLLHHSCIRRFVTSTASRRSSMAYSILPSLSSWWHNVQNQHFSTPRFATCQCSLKPSRHVRHNRPVSAAPFARNSDTTCDDTQYAQAKRLPVKQNKHRRRQCRVTATPDSDSSLGITLNSADTNQLQTALNQAIAAEDYTLASKLRDQISMLVGSSGTADWRQLGVPEWLADRIERMGYKYATEVQKQAAEALKQGRDVVVQSQTGSGKTLAFLLPLLSRLQYPPDLYPEDLKGPQLVIMVPTRELGVQTVMLIYKLFGGAVNSQVPGDAANMFTYQGPRGLKVKGVLDQEEVLFAKHKGYLFGAHVVVGTPECLAAASKGPDAVSIMQHAMAVAVDEVDACFLEQGEAMQSLLSDACQQHPKPILALVGATIQEGLADTAASMGWMDEALSVRLRADEPLPAGLQHHYIVVPPERKLAVLCRQIRADLLAQGDDAAPTRVIVFAPSPEAAQAAAQPIRNVLWGQHNVTVLLPQGEEPIKALHSFRDNKSSLLIATPQAARGLDLPAVSHVYNLGPPDTPTEYLHRAGRAGRIGSPPGGVITTLVTEEHVPELLGIAQELKVDMNQAYEPTVEPLQVSDNGDSDLAPDVDKAKQGLEDIFNLY